MTIKRETERNKGASHLSLEYGNAIHVSIHWTLFDGAELTHRDPIHHSAVRTVGGSSIVPYESLADLLRVCQRVE